MPKLAAYGACDLQQRRRNRRVLYPRYASLSTTC